MKAARRRQGTKRGADHLREDQAWSERHGSEQQMSATRFAAPTAGALLLFAEPVLPGGDAAVRDVCPAEGISPRRVADGRLRRYRPRTRSHRVIELIEASCHVVLAPDPRRSPGADRIEDGCNSAK